MINAVIFDMDGLLINTEKYLFRFWKQAAEEFGYVLKGSVTLVRDNKKYKLKAKDTFYVNGKKSHYLYNHTNSEALILWVTTPPMF